MDTGLLTGQLAQLDVHADAQLTSVKKTEEANGTTTWTVTYKARRPDAATLAATTMRKHGRTLILFDVDGTLAVPAQPAAADMIATLAKLREQYAVGIVGAGDFEKQQMQLGGPDLRDRLDFCFSENGVHSFRGAGNCLHSKSLESHLGAERWQAFLAELDELLLAHRDEAAALLARVLTFLSTPPYLPLYTPLPPATSLASTSLTSRSPAWCR